MILAFEHGHDHDLHTLQGHLSTASCMCPAPFGALSCDFSLASWNFTHALGAKLFGRRKETKNPSQQSDASCKCGLNGLQTPGCPVATQLYAQQNKEHLNVLQIAGDARLEAWLLSPFLQILSTCIGNACHCILTSFGRVSASLPKCPENGHAIGESFTRRDRGLEVMRPTRLVGSSAIHPQNTLQEQVLFPKNTQLYFLDS